MNVTKHPLEETVSYFDHAYDSSPKDVSLLSFFDHPQYVKLYKLRSLLEWYERNESTLSPQGKTILSELQELIALFSPLFGAKKEISTKEYLELIREHERYKLLKKALPCITVSGTFEKRRVKSNFKQHTGFICADIDFHDRSQALAFIDAHHTNIFFAYLSLSASATGVFCLIKISEPEKHLWHFEAIKQDFEQIGISIDPLPDVTRLRFHAGTAGHINPQPKMYEKQSKANPLTTHIDFSTLPALEHTSTYDKPRFMKRLLGKTYEKGYSLEESVYPTLFRAADLARKYGLSEDYITHYLYEKYLESERVQGDPSKYTAEYFTSALEHAFTAYPLTHNKLRLEDSQKKGGIQEKIAAICQSLGQEVERNKDIPIDTLHDPAILAAQNSLQGQGSHTYTLKKGQYLSCLQLPVEDSSIWDIDTNSGKTYYIVNDDSKKVVLFPTQDLAIQTGSEYRKHVVWEGHEINEDATQVGTYNAISKFLKLSDKAERSLVIDEAHNLALAASLGYKKELMNELLDAAGEFKNLLLLSGTWIPTLHPALSKLKHISVRKELTYEKCYSFIVYKDRLGALFHKLQRGKLNIVYLQSKGMAKTYGQYFEKKGVVTRLFNADTKHLTDHREIVRYNEVSPSVEVLFVTSLFNEGLNIYNINIGDIHILSKASEYEIEQLANRTRRAFPGSIYIYLSEKASFMQDISFDLLKRQEKLLEEAKQMLSSGNSWLCYAENSQKEVNAQQLVAQLAGEKRNLLRVVKGKLEVDYLGIANVALAEKTRLSYKNIRLLMEGLSSFGYRFVEIEYVGAKRQEESYQEAKKEIDSEEGSDFARVLETFRMAGIDLAHRIDTGFVTATPKERAVAAKLIKLSFSYTFEDALAILESVGEDERKWNRVRTQIAYQKHLHDPSPVKTIDIKTIDELYTSFQVGESATSEEFSKRFYAILEKNPKTRFTPYSPTMAMRKLGEAFSLERTSVREKGKIIKVYTLTDNNPLGKPFLAKAGKNERGEQPAEESVPLIEKENIIENSKISGTPHGELLEQSCLGWLERKQEPCPF